MSSPAYIMITVAAVSPDYLSEALGKVGTLCGQLKDQAGALMTRYGVLSTGEHAGSLFLSQGYSELNGIDAAFNVYGSSAEYQALIGSGKVSVTLRNIMRMEDIGLKSPSTNVPALKPFAVALILTVTNSLRPGLINPLVAVGVFQLATPVRSHHSRAPHEGTCLRSVRQARYPWKRFGHRRPPSRTDRQSR